MSITNPYGVDIYIETLKGDFTSDLWSGVDFSGITYTSYGRAFLNIKKNQRIPEILIDSTKEYQEVLFNDKIDASSFFHVLDNREYIGKNEFSVQVDIIFQVKLDSLYPDLTHRATEEVISDAEKIIIKSPFKIQNVKTGLSAYENFELNDLSKYNFQPNFLFKFETQLTGLFRKCES